MKEQTNMFRCSLPDDTGMIDYHQKKGYTRFKNRNGDTYIPVIHPDSNDAATGIIVCSIIFILSSIVFILFGK